MIIVGGTYDEYCFEPRWEQKFGSGLRGCHVIMNLSPRTKIDFYTFGDKITKEYLSQLSVTFSKLTSHVSEIPKTVSFYYDHPLIVPRIFPRPDLLEKNKNKISTIKGKDVLFYGMLEGQVSVDGERVVYDPQSPASPISFSATGSKANKLAVVINFFEASKIAGSDNITKIKKHFFKQENVNVLVIKMGPKGALVLSNINQTGTIIPVYRTNTVWPVGSGDVFAATFAHFWFKDYTPEDAAQKASLHTAIYCNTRSLNFKNYPTNNIKPISIGNIPKGLVYLAGPFFTYSQRWLIDQLRASFLHLNLNVFSPWHDVGMGTAEEVVDKDIEGLDQSKLVFAVVDGLDSGTIFEIGYAISKQIPVIVYVQNESKESIKMLEGTGCIIEPDLTTAIYKSLWMLAENE